MKLILIACLFAVALARPQDLNDVPILRDDRLNEGNGNFNYDFETGNGIVVSAVGTPGVEGQSNIQGTYTYPVGDGTVVEVTYIADETGFRPSVRLVKN
ncbi:cuticle protein AMP4-like [Penaeus japonicus]|uniref:cuticle protein AMP4-like n=1 Tax=Penaeus japonicus TaxID=27405 RepID=UPI001C70CCCC|nr:cuticle protein AMP4-like [Penaeus japonicus]